MSKMKHQPSEVVAVGFCHNNIHRGYVGQRILKEHECINKNCPYFEKFEDSPHWCKKEVVKLLKKAKKKGHMAIMINGRCFTSNDENKLANVYLKEYKKYNKKPTTGTIKYISGLEKEIL